MNSLAEAEKENTLTVSYEITDKAIESLSEKYSGLSAGGSKGYKEVVAGISVIRSYRVKVEAKRKELKADSLAWGRKVDAEAKRITAALLEIEEPLKLAKKEVDDEKERIKQEKIRLEQERIEGIKAKIRGISHPYSHLANSLSSEINEELDCLSLRDITEEDFQEFTSEAQAELARVVEQLQAWHQQALDREERERQAEEERKRQAEEAERLRKEREEFEREQAEAQAKAKAEQDERDRIERDRLEKIEAEERARQAKIDAENRRIEEESRKLEEERQAIEREKERARMEQEAKEKAERELKEKQESEERERIAREKAEAERKAREEALKPDREKLKTWAENAVAALPLLSDQVMQIRVDNLRRELTTLIEDMS